MSLVRALEKMTASRVLVVGDLMLDRFVYGDVTRISPESPVPVLKVTREDLMPGGAGNVLANLKGLGVAATIVALIGDDDDGALMTRLAGALGETALVTAADRPTIVKTRFLASHQHMLRVDEERSKPITPETEAGLIAAVERLVPQHQALVLSDYNKGVLSKTVLKAAIAAAKKAGIPVLVDPKGTDYGCYAGADIVTPNRKELAEATGGLPTATDADIEAAAGNIIATAGIAAVVATRSQDGMSVIRQGDAPLHLRAQALEVFDVSGAGDTVIATIAAALAAGASLNDAAALANLAGGIVVAKVGTAAIRAEELLRAANGEGSTVSASGQAALCGWDEAREQVKRWQAQGLKVGFTNGCFDILHAGHVHYLNEARGHCDRLVLGLNHDASVRILKGPTRPVNIETDRATVIGGLGAVSLVVLFGAEEKGQDNTPCALIDHIRPDLFFKGGDYTVDQLPEAKIVQAYGGEVRLMGLTAGLSTTNTIKKIGGGSAAA